MSRESDLLDEIERRQSVLKNMTEVESRLLDKVVEIDDEITKIQHRFEALESIVREKVLTVATPSIDTKLAAIYDLLKHLALYESAIQIDSKNRVKKLPPEKNGILSRFGV